MKMREEDKVEEEEEDIYVIIPPYRFYSLYLQASSEWGGASKKQKGQD